jgi:hypothetical protein
LAYVVLSIVGLLVLSICILINPFILVLSLIVTIIVVPFNLGRHLLARRALPRWTGDVKRPPILYLRSFSDDEKINALGIFSHLGLFETEEQTISRFLSHIGPVISIGRPNEILAPLGARRMYVDDTQWQNAVVELLEQSLLIVLRLGYSRGLSWEIETVVRLCDPRRVIVYCPLPFAERKSRSREHLYDLRRRLNEEHFPFPLPSAESVGDIISFSETWRPISKKTRVGVFGFIRFKARGSRLPYIREAMRPILSNLDIKVPSCLTIRETLLITWLIVTRGVLLMVIAPAVLIDGILTGYPHEFGQGITMSIFGSVIIWNLWSSVGGFWRQ